MSRGHNRERALKARMEAETPLRRVESIPHKAAPRDWNRRGHGTEEVTSMQEQRTRWFNRETLEARFWAKVNKTDGCWFWTGNRTTAGYGQVRQNTVNKMAHRVAYEWSVSAIPEGYEIDHLCENPACVNPAHLEAVSHQANIERATGKRTACKYGHPLDGWTRNGPERAGRRYCKTCDRAKSQRKAARRKAARNA